MRDEFTNLSWPPIPGTHPSPVQPRLTLAQLVTMSDNQLAAVDLAEMNLAVAAGLPHAKNLDQPAYFAKLDAMAEAVIAETENFRPNFRPNPSCPTEADYRLYMLAKVCRDHFGLRHFLMPEKGTGFTGIIHEGITDEQWSDLRNWFIHGLLGPERIGSCTSMPVLYAAVGRRIGYPIRLVLALRHVFARWDDGQRQINLEATGPDYINNHPNEYYIDRPKPWNDRQKAYFLRTITPRQELAMMLSCRAAVLKHSGNLADLSARRVFWTRPIRSIRRSADKSNSTSLHCRSISGRRGCIARS